MENPNVNGENNDFDKKNVYFKSLLVGGLLLFLISLTFHQSAIGRQETASVAIFLCHEIPEKMDCNTYEDMFYDANPEFWHLPIGIGIIFSLGSTIALWLNWTSNNAVKRAYLQLDAMNK